MDAKRHPWALGGITLPGCVLAELTAEARAAYDRGEEACGYLTGPSAVPLLVDRAHPMPNLASRYHGLDPGAFPRGGRTSFLIDARLFQRAVDEGDAAGQPVKVLWHSHLEVGAYFSDTDAEAANRGARDLAYLVTSVRGGEVDEHRLFVRGEAGQSYVEATLVIGP